MSSCRLIINSKSRMDALTIALLLAAVVLSGFLVFSPKRAANTRHRQVLPGAGLSTKKAAWEQGNLALEQQTRFVETPKRKQYRLLNDSEQVLYQRLCEAMPSMQVFAQVGVAQLALLRGRQEAQRLGNMLGRGVDFVVCDTEFSIIAAIELAWPRLDDGADQAENDKREALQSLGIPLIVFRPNSLPDAESISREIADAIVRRNRLEASRH